MASTAENEWSDDVCETDRVIVWGRGACSAPALRAASFDWAYATSTTRAWLEQLNTTDVKADGFCDDYWCAALYPTEIAASELDADRSVAGYEIVES